MPLPTVHRAPPAKVPATLSIPVTLPREGKNAEKLREDFTAFILSAYRTAYAAQGVTIPDDATASFNRTTADGTVTYDFVITWME